MHPVKSITLPSRIVVGEDVIGEIPTLIEDLNLGSNVILVVDRNTYTIAGEKIEQILVDSNINVRIFFSENSTEKTVSDLRRFRKKELLMIGAGGGSVIDVAKAASFSENIHFMSVPTAPSHDGIASPMASIKKEGVKHSIVAHPPAAIVADIEILKNAPRRLFNSGCADVISNYTAVLDWKLAHRIKGEYYGDYAASLSLLSSRILMENADLLRSGNTESVRVLMEALISSSVAMSIAGSSRPCSGSEHLFSHALDILAPGRALHGEQCGVGTIISAYLHGEDWMTVKNTLETIGAPTSAEELNIEDDVIVKALVMAQKIRDRYTILTGITEKAAREAARRTGVI